MILIKPTSFVDEAQSQFEYISVQFIRKGLDHHIIKAVSKSHLKDR